MSLHVLIVDDDELVRMNLELVLSLEGYRVGTADSGMSALRIIETRRPDLVVLDITMSGMNGWDTIRKLRSRSDTSVLPVVALSGDRRDPANFRRAGFNAYLPKGGSLDRFLATIRAAFDHHVGPERLWLHPGEGEAFNVVPLTDSDAAITIPGGCADPLMDYLTGLPPIAHHAALDGHRHLTPRI